MVDLVPSTTLHLFVTAYGFALVGLLGGLLLLLVYTPLRWTSNRWIRIACEVILITAHVFLFFLLFLEFRLVDLLGLHLDSPWLWESLANPDVMRELQIGANTWIGAALLVGGGVAIEWLLLWICKRVVQRMGRTKWGNNPRLVRILMGIWLFSVSGTLAIRWVAPAEAHRIGQELPLYPRLLGPPIYDANWTAIQYPSNPVESPSLSPKRPIIFVMVESFRADHLTPELTPHLWSLKQRKNCWSSPRHYSTSHTTEVGVFAMLYGLHPTHYTPFASDNIAAVPFRFLRDNDYVLGGASSSQLRHWNQGEFMVDQLDSYQEFLDPPVHANDTSVIRWAKTYMDEHIGEHPFFLFLFLNAPHHNYYYPPEFERFVPTIDKDYDHFLGDEKLAAHQTGIHNRYRNSLLFMDASIGQLLEHTDALPGPKPIVVITGDHGEEFWEHGLLGHGASKFWNERIQVPLVACIPNASAHADVAFTSHVDVWPTVFDALQSEETANQGAASYSNGHSWLRPPPADPWAFVGGMTFPYKYEQACLIDKETKTWVRLCAGDQYCVRHTRFTDVNDNPTQHKAEHVARRIRALSNEIQRFVTLSSD